MRKDGKRLETRGDTGSADRDSGREGGVRRRSPARGFFTVLFVLAILCLSAFTAWKIYIAPPAIAPPVNNMNTDPSAPVGVDGATGVPAESSSKLRDGVYTVLLVGTFEDGNTDTIMSVTFDTKEKRVDVVGIPRDTTTLWNGNQVKINSIYSRAGGDGKGLLALQDEVASLLGFRPNNFAMMKMSGFKKLVDAMGGVEFDVPIKMYHYDGKNTINLQKGVQILDGDKALQLMRFRGYSSNNKAGVDHDDFGRIQMQQRFILTVFKDMLKFTNLAKISEYVKIASENISPTDLELKNMLWFADKLLGVKSEDIHFCTLPTKTSGQGYYENVRSEDALKLINETINPYTKPITADRCEWPQHK